MWWQSHKTVGHIASVVRNRGMSAGAKLNFSLFLQSRIPVPWISTMYILSGSPYLRLSSLIMFLQTMPELSPKVILDNQDSLSPLWMKLHL